MKELDEVEKKIKEKLQQIVIESKNATKQNKNSDEWWTKGVKKKLCNLAHEMDYAVTANGCDDAEDKQEWLFDMIWTHKEEFKEIILAMECEWSKNRDDVLEDFEKLLVVRSKYRIFIFNQYNRSEIENMMEEFRKKIDKFKSTLSGDRYFFAGYCVDEDEVIFDNKMVP